MIRHVTRKLLQLLIVLFLASVLTFLLIQISPGDPATMFLTSKGTMPTEELLDQTREEMGLNKPVIVQYAQWITGALKGDLGISYHLKVSVSDLLSQRLMMTVKLAVTAFVFLLFFSTVLGILSAVYKGKWLDYIIRGLALMGISIPNFWLGLILIYAFVVKVHIFKLTDTTSVSSVVLPAVTIAIPMVGRYTRQIRSVVLEESKADYVSGARAKGISEGKIYLSYILPNGMKQLITLFGLSVAGLLGGTVIVENIFAWPGIGALAVEAITYRDYPLLQGYVLLMALIYVTVNLFADLLTQSLDPRLRGGGAHE